MPAQSNTGHQDSSAIRNEGYIHGYINVHEYKFKIKTIIIHA